MMEGFKDNVVEIKNNEMLQSFFNREELVSVVFMKEGFLHKKIRKNNVFEDLTIH